MLNIIEKCFCPHCERETEQRFGVYIQCTICEKINNSIPTIHGHLLYTADDFNADDTSPMYIKVVESGIPTCKLCGCSEEDLESECEYRDVDEYSGKY